MHYLLIDLYKGAKINLFTVAGLYLFFNETFVYLQIISCRYSTCNN